MKIDLKCRFKIYIQIKNQNIKVKVFIKIQKKKTNLVSSNLQIYLFQNLDIIMIESIVRDLDGIARM